MGWLTLADDLRSLTTPGRCIEILPGQYFDAETGLHQNWHRDYDPSIGRYLPSDPIGLMAGVNTYGYVRANPLSRIDALGLADVYVWMPHGDDSYGHASLLLDSGEYISWWPTQEQTSEKDACGCSADKINENFFSAPAIQGRSFAADKIAEGRPPDSKVHIDGLDEDAISAWWNAFKSNPNNVWDTKRQNCSTTVYDALRAGGGLPSYSPLWSPEQVRTYAKSAKLYRGVANAVQGIQ